jgi:hypothetical protein
MTICYITTDTEYDFGFTRRHGPASRGENFNRSIRCATPSGEVGICYQMDVLDRFGLKAVFFVDPMPALVWGTSAIEDIVRPIVERGHDVQLHMHTEWLELAGNANPIGKKTGSNIKDFSPDQQCTLLGYAKDVLVAAGAPAPVAFRAGNYGASDDTLRALASVGLRYDTSHCPGFHGSPCTISLTSTHRTPIEHCGLIEVPIGCIAAPHGALRHAQITALSATEVVSAIKHCVAHEIGHFTLVSHSFELTSRDRTHVNRIVRRRFDKLCAKLATIAGVIVGTYTTNPPQACPQNGTDCAPVLPLNPARLGFRLAEQAIGNALYGRR